MVLPVFVLRKDQPSSASFKDSLSYTLAYFDMCSPASTRAFATTAVAAALTVRSDITALTSNQSVIDFVNEAVALCKPDSVHICDGSAEEATAYVSYQEWIVFLGPSFCFSWCCWVSGSGCGNLHALAHPLPETYFSPRPNPPAPGWRRSW